MNWKPRIGYWGLVVLLSLLLVACASQQEIRLPDQFETETLVDGSKRFSFVLNFAPRFGGAGQADGEGRQQEGQPQRAPTCLLYTSPSPRDQRGSRMPSSA